MDFDYNKYSYQPNFKPIDHLFESRLRQFVDTGGQYSNLNLPKFYDFKRIDTNTESMNLSSYQVPDDKEGKTQRPLFSEINWKEVEWKGANKGFSFGPSWKTIWFKLEYKIPSDWINEDPEVIEFEWDSNSEAMLYSDEGVPLQAFTGGNERTIYKLPKKNWISKLQTFYIEMACNGMFGNGSDGVPDPNRYFQIAKCDLVIPNLEARRLYWDFWIVSDAAREFPGSSAQKWQANQICNDVMNIFDPEDVNSISACRKLLQKYIGTDINSSDVFNSKSKIDVLAIGNCHIDTAWLWPFAETKRKIVRSWTTQLRVAEKYPEYVFVASQMQQFKWLKEYHPEILAQVKEKFTTNQFLPIGGSWVENDTNMPNGESLIRQFLLGQRYMKNEFGFESNIFWLPDTFGYSSQIPQICQLVGITRFLTQKLSWNNINQFPLSTFNWVGIDRSQVLVHMPPANTYTADAHFGDVMRSLAQHKNLRDVPTGLLLYGKGDGGGGPSEEMIEKLRRCRGLSDTSGLLPTVHVGNTVDEFYDDVLKRSNNGKKLPSWTGEIYLEFHRGTYTSQAKVKKYMRIGEVKLHDLEWIATLVSLSNKSYKYPSHDINALWEDLCLCQFHDVLPGSCIGMVYYEEVLPMLEKLMNKEDSLIKKALEALEGTTDLTHTPTFMNTLPWKRNEVIRMKKKEASVILGKNSQYGITDGEEQILYVSTECDGKASLLLKDDIEFPARAYKVDDSFVLTNEKIKATFSKDGILTSLYDILNKRESIDTTKTEQTDNDGVIGGNQYLIFDDEPLTYPAWDTELYSLNKFKFLKSNSVEILSSNAFESSIVVKTKISEHSTIETIISIQGLTGSSVTQNNFLKFKCKVNWNESYKFLKVQFPTTIYAADSANYETQFGLTARPTHFNTSWDIAKFEVCQHKFMDLSEYNYGISIMNNCKYGAAIHGNLMRLSLLRSPKAPDDRADMGYHEFEYAIYPHDGSLSMDTVKLAWNFNYPIENHTFSAKLSQLSSAISLSSSDGLVLSHIKRSEDDEGVSTLEKLPVRKDGKKSFIIRVYEALGGSGTGVFTVDESVFQIDTILKVDGLEKELETIESKENSANISLRPFEIATYKIILK